MDEEINSPGEDNAKLGICPFKFGKGPYRGCSGQDCSWFSATPGKCAVQLIAETMAKLALE